MEYETYGTRRGDGDPSLRQHICAYDRNGNLQACHDRLLEALKKIRDRADGGSTWTDIRYIAATAIKAAEKETS